jgi:SAM-dependent methyltransferase
MSTDQSTIEQGTLQQDTAGIDGEAVGAFAERLLGVLNDTGLAIMLSIGSRTGLLDALAGLPPSTSQEVAGAAGLDERYVREWLKALTVARVVEHEPVGDTYRLPPENAASLTRAAGPGNLARAMQLPVLLAGVEDPIVECFQKGGGLSYAHYPRFHRLMAEDSAAVFDLALLDMVLPLVPGVVDRLRSGIDVADIGCGSGHAINLLARAFPASRFTGYDFSEEAITVARAEAASWGLDNARFEIQDVAELPTAGAHDLVTAFDAIHDQAHPAEVLRRIHATLRPGGTFLMVDMRASSNVDDNLDLPGATFLYTVSTLHCMTVSLGLGGDGLGTAWGEQLALSMLRDAGFGHVEVASIEPDPFNSYYVAQRD